MSASAGVGLANEIKTALADKPPVAPIAFLLLRVHLAAPHSRVIAIVNRSFEVSEVSKKYRLVRRQFIPRSVEETFAFFSDAMNLEAITPAFLKFKILTPAPILLQRGTVIDYRLKIMHVPVRWQSIIETFEPNRRFTDTQLRGPYRRWHHLHEFTPVEGGTLMTDCVDYEVPLGPLGSLAHVLFVNRSLQQIFDYRQTKVIELLGEPSLEQTQAYANA
ncbi:MAG: SRPBCC family protein [Planctomycetia bacterium]|nr:SRPBCC family protein [Planctomycetia bacterium]